METTFLIVKTLVLPPSGLLLLAGVGWVISTRWRQTGHTAVVFSLSSLLLISIPVISDLLLSGLQENCPLQTGRRAPTAGAIVILGGERKQAAEYGGKTVGPLTLERLRYGARLHRELQAPILVTGGKPPLAEKSIAKLMAESLEHDFNVIPRWQEREAKNTYQNAKFTAETLKKEGINEMLLVTHAWHMPRARKAFESFGLIVIPAPTGCTVKDSRMFLTDFVPSAIALEASTAALYEYLGILWYELYYFRF